MSRPSLPKIRGTQVGLKNPALVDQIKANMRSGQFAYDEIGCCIAGVRDRNGTYHVKEGHHRVVAVMELYRETKDSSYVKNLILNGKFDEQENSPVDSRPLPSCHWWGAFRNWLGI
jgi:filamentous hemagglutinin